MAPAKTQGVNFPGKQFEQQFKWLFPSFAVQFWINPAVNGQQSRITYMDYEDLAAHSSKKVGPKLNQFSLHKCLTRDTRALAINPKCFL